jgi:hypothetical protein
MINSAARAIPAPEYVPFICRVAGCKQLATQAHHITYDGRVPKPWALFALCDEHHERLHRLHELVRDEVPVVFFTLQYAVDPERIERWARKTEFPWAPKLAKPVHPQQLSLGDRMGVSGQYWRQFEAEERRQFEEDDPEAPY